MNSDPKLSAPSHRGTDWGTTGWKKVSHGAHRRRGDGRSGWANQQVTNKLLKNKSHYKSIDRTIIVINPSIHDDVVISANSRTDVILLVNYSNINMLICYANIMVIEWNHFYCSVENYVNTLICYNKKVVIERPSDIILWYRNILSSLCLLYDTTSMTSYSKIQ